MTAAPAFNDSEALLRAFDESEAQGRRAASTRKAYRNTLARFAKAYPDLLSVGIEAAGEWLADQDPARQAAVRAFYSWAAEEGIYHGKLAALRVRRTNKEPTPSPEVAAPTLSLVPPVTFSKNCTATVTGRMAILRDYLWRMELGPRTIEGYIRQAREADWWCEQQGYTLRNVPAIVLAQYVDMRPKTYASRRALRCALVHYWAAFKRKDPPLWVLKVPRKPRAVCRALTEDEATRLASAARERGGLEGFAVLLGMYQGLRRSEIAAVAWHDFIDGDWLTVMGKGDVAAKLPVHPVVAEAARKLEREHPVWVFPGRARGGTNERHANPASVWKWIVTVAEEAGIENVTPHRLRHTCLAMANDVTGDLRAVQDFARHRRPDTTAGYTRTTERRLRAVLVALDYDKGAPERLEVQQRLVTKMVGLSVEQLGEVERLVEGFCT